MISEICFNEILVNSAQTVFETMIFMDISDSCIPEMVHTSPKSILGSITFKGTIEGCLSISCSQECGQLIAMNMLGLDTDEPISNEEIHDAIGEVSNMVMGSVKGALDGSPILIEVSIPTVVRGTGLEQCVYDGSSKEVFEAFLDGTYPITIQLEYRQGKERCN